MRTVQALCAQLRSGVRAGAPEDEPLRAARPPDERMGEGAMKEVGGGTRVVAVGQGGEERQEVKDWAHRDVHHPRAAHTGLEPHRELALETTSVSEAGEVRGGVKGATRRPGRPGQTPLTERPHPRRGLTPAPQRLSFRPSRKSTATAIRRGSRTAASLGRGRSARCPMRVQRGPSTSKSSPPQAPPSACE